MFHHCYTQYSKGFGVLSVGSIVAKAKEKGQSMLAISDINSISGWDEFASACRGKQIMPIFGLEVRINGKYHYSLFAKGVLGKQEIQKFHKKGIRFGFPQLAPAFSDVMVMYPLLYKPLDLLRSNEFWWVRPSQLTHVRLLSLNTNHPSILPRLAVTFTGAEDYRLHLSIWQSIWIAGSPAFSESAYSDERFLSTTELQRIFGSCLGILESGKVATQQLQRLSTGILPGLQLEMGY